MKSKSGARVALLLLALVLLGGGLWLARRGPNLSPATQKLFQGLKDKDMTTISTALAQGADVHARDEFGYTPLMRAVMEGVPAATSVLIDKGADINARTSANETALIIAIKFRQVEAINVLLDHKAATNVQDIEGQTALTWARRYHLSQVAARLEANSSQ